MRKFKKRYILLLVIVFSAIMWWWTFRVDFVKFITQEDIDPFSAMFWIIHAIVNILFIYLFIYLFKSKIKRKRIVSIVQIFIITFLIESDLWLIPLLCERINMLILPILYGTTRIITIPIITFISWLTIRRMEGNSIWESIAKS